MANTILLNKTDHAYQRNGILQVNKSGEEVLLRMDHITGIESDLRLSPSEAQKLGELLIRYAMPPSTFRPTPIPTVRNGKLIE